MSDDGCPRLHDALLVFRGYAFQLVADAQDDSQRRTQFVSDVSEELLARLGYLAHGFVGTLLLPEGKPQRGDGSDEQQHHRQGCPEDDVVLSAYLGISLRELGVLTLQLVVVEFGVGLTHQVLQLFGVDGVTHAGVALQCLNGAVRVEGLQRLGQCAVVIPHGMRVAYLLFQPDSFPQGFSCLAGTAYIY